MSEEGSLKELVVREATEQVDVADLVGEGDVAEGIDGEAVGASVGGRLGERIGRSIGEAVGEAIHEAASSEGDETDRSVRAVLADVAAAVREAIVDAVSGDDGSVVSSARESLEEAGGDAEDGVEEEESDVEETAGEAEETADDTEQAEAASEQDGAESDEEVPSAEDLEELRRETLEDFLEVLSYRDLQSVAKDVGVKANLAREEMTDRIVETVADGETEEEPS